MLGFYYSLNLLIYLLVIRFMNHSTVWRIEIVKESFLSWRAYSK